jgi:hypothetical protein
VGSRRFQRSGKRDPAFSGRLADDPPAVIALYQRLLDHHDSGSHPLHPKDSVALRDTLTKWSDSGESVAELCRVLGVQSKKKRRTQKAVDAEVGIALALVNAVSYGSRFPYDDVINASTKPVSLKTIKRAWAAWGPYIKRSLAAAAEPLDESTRAQRWARQSGLTLKRIEAMLDTKSRVGVHTKEP